MVNPTGRTLANYNYRIVYLQPILQRREVEFDHYNAIKDTLTFDQRDAMFNDILYRYGLEVSALLPDYRIALDEAIAQDRAAARSRASAIIAESNRVMEEENRVMNGLIRIERIRRELVHLNTLRRLRQQRAAFATYNEIHDNGGLNNDVEIEDQLIVAGLQHEVESISATITHNERHDYGYAPAQPTSTEMRILNSIHAGNARRRRNSHRKKKSHKSRRA
jgi:hypothetical protein